MQKCIQVLSIVLIAFTLVGCAKCISTESIDDTVEIVNEHFEDSYTTMFYNATTKQFVPTVHSATYCITVKYNDMEFDIDDQEAYEKYADKIGDYAVGTFTLRKYDDGSIRYTLIGLE